MLGGCCLAPAPPGRSALRVETQPWHAPALGGWRHPEPGHWVLRPGPGRGQGPNQVTTLSKDLGTTTSWGAQSRPMASSRAVGVSRPRSAARTSGTRRHLHTFRLARCSPFRPLHFQLLIWKRKKKPAGRGSNPNRGCSGPARARARAPHTAAPHPGRGRVNCSPEPGLHGSRRRRCKRPRLGKARSRAPQEASCRTASVRGAPRGVSVVSRGEPEAFCSQTPCPQTATRGHRPGS